tara:strand:+ start:369 stop:518 length:150 start_codon:yes stop_codon:yes gene_type:complete
MEYYSRRLSSSAQTFLSVLEHNNRQFIRRNVIKIKRQPSVQSGLNTIKK